ncbi:MAG: peptidoglycan-binding domain 1 protein [Bacteroidetes bacterium]|nr:peptidoglycan-binding domain 1 protein [Bacteroidota bacterium]
MRPFHILPVLFAFAFTGAQAQIFINTGNSSIDKYKQENPNVTVSSPTDSAKVQTEVKTPGVKIKQAEQPAPTKKIVAVKKEATKSVKTEKTTVATTPTTSAVPAAAPVDMPPNAEVGKCYARCVILDKYESREETVIDKPLSYKTKNIPAIYKTIIDTLVIKPASIRYKDVPAIYETTTEDILVTPATQKWVKGTADAGCLSANPADCQVMCLKEIPAVYKKVSRQSVKTPATRVEVPVAAEYKVITKKVVDQPARTEQIEIPATYKDVVHKELVSKGGYSEWREILCGDKLTTAKITEIQKALKANGYDPGTIDNVFGGKTKEALIKYQKDKNLPVGNLNMETLKSLGVQ